jgi:hypothetical protein
MSNLDLNAAKRIIYMLSNFYPERMGQCLIVSAPMVFSAVWAVIRPWLSRRTQTKVQFCKAEELGRWIAPAALPSFWGGLDQTVYSARYVALSLACEASLAAPPLHYLHLGLLSLGHASSWKGTGVEGIRARFLLERRMWSTHGEMREWRQQIRRMQRQTWWTRSRRLGRRRR